MILERLGGTMPDEDDRENFRADFMRLHAVVGPMHSDRIRRLAGVLIEQRRNGSIRGRQ